MDKTIVKGFTMLEHLANSHAPCGVTDLSKALELKKSNVHRILSTLIGLGYVSQDPETSKYSATLRTWEIGVQVHSRIDVRREAIPFMKEIAEHTRETVDLAVLSGMEVIFLETIESTQVVRAFSRYGTRIPAWCTAAGRVILAYSSRKMIDLIPEDLTAYTLNTITNRDALIAELDTVRTEGFSVNRGELDESVWSMGVPVWSTAAVPIAAVSFSAPADRFQKRDIVADAEWLRELARSLSRRLGSTPA